MTAKYEHIATITLDSSTSSVTFSSIPQGYRDLELVFSGTTTNGQGPRFVYNSESAATNYSRVIMVGTGSSTSSSSDSGTTNGQKALQTNATQSTGVVQLLDYSATDKHKTVLSRTGPANDVLLAIAQRWANTAAITNIQIISDTSFSTGSTFDLYGIVGGA